jgi:two-component system, NarL family, nitrate/nitrite sensor histidine kinase NarX
VSEDIQPLRFHAPRKAGRIPAESVRKETHQGYKLPALKVLSEISASLSSGDDVERLLSRYLSTLIRLADAEAGAVRVLTSDGRQMRLIGALGLPDDVAELEEFMPLDCGVCGSAADEHLPATKSAKTCHDATGHSYFSDNLSKVVAVPLRYQGRLMGVYNLFLRPGHEVPEDVALLFQSIGEHLGMALENARLHRENLRVTLSNERQMLANQIHDSLAQTLAYAKMRLSALRGALGARNEALSDKYMVELEEALGTAYSGLRDHLTQFRQRMDPRGLLPAIKSLAEQTQNKNGFKVEFVDNTRDLNLSTEQEVHVFHIVQEALANICKHARAKHVQITVSQQDDLFIATVSDDGVGLKRRRDSSVSMNLGLEIMRERARQLRGEIVFESKPRRGTTVHLRFPLITKRYARTS